MHARLLLLLLFVVLCACMAGRAHAQDGGLVHLDASRSSGGFRVKVVWLLGINGDFGRIDGDVRLFPLRDTLRVYARVDATSLRMSSARYANWAKSEEFFDVARHPQIGFTSEEVPRARLRDGGDLSGWLTVRGVTQPVRFALLPAECARPAYDCPIRVNGTIRRSQFGMGSHRATLADKVELDFRIYALGGAGNGALTPG